MLHEERSEYTAPSDQKGHRPSLIVKHFEDLTAAISLIALNSSTGSSHLILKRMVRHGRGVTEALHRQHLHMQLPLH